MKLSVVMPAQDEALRLPKTLQALEHWQSTAGIHTEIVIADDGSVDGTAEVARRSTCLPVEVVRVDGRAGVGHAVRAGMLAAKGERILLCDADGAVPFEYTLDLWRALDAGHDVALGSRRAAPHCIEIPQPWLRRLSGHVWGKLARAVVATGVGDTQCGFKLFSHAAAKNLFTACAATTFAFHVEVIALAQAQQMRLIEIPVRWRDVAGSKIRLRTDSARMARELFGIRRRLRERRAPQTTASQVFGTQVLAGWGSRHAVDHDLTASKAVE